jgi:hypothetical protein
MNSKLKADYLVVGTGAVGMAFVDSLIVASDALVVMIDRRHAPGGHWHDAYPFVRLHQPSAYYGVNSLPLGEDRIDRSGTNAGLLERATAPEILGYYARVMDEHLLPSGRVEHFPLCKYLGDNRFVSHVTGTHYEVDVGKAVVDANYLCPAVPATTPPPFEVEAGTRCIAIGELARVSEAPSGYVIIGAGKTAMDACVWLLQNGVAPERIRWIKPRESWLVNREFVQSGEMVGSLIEGLSLQMQAAVEAESLPDLFRRLEASRLLLRIDADVEPTMYKAATVDGNELALLRSIGEVVRLGRVRRIERNRIVLEGGNIPTDANWLHVHCAAAGLNPAPAVPIFAEGRITLQPVRSGLLPFNAAIVAYIEATRDDLAEKNRLCPVNRLPDTPLDWLRGLVIQTRADYQWTRRPDIVAWLERARLNAPRGMLTRAANDARVREGLQRYVTHVTPGLKKLEAMIAAADVHP